jgi:hypothetical protein
MLVVEGYKGVLATLASLLCLKGENGITSGLLGVFCSNYSELLGSEGQKPRYKSTSIAYWKQSWM